MKNLTSLRVWTLFGAETVLLGLLFLGGVGTPHVAEAACQTQAAGGLQDPLCFNNIYDFIQGVLQAFVYISIPFLSFFFVYSGFKFVMARGNTEALGKAKNNFTYLIIGAILILGAWALAELIKNTVNQIAG